jgi:hypothetical protein
MSVCTEMLIILRGLWGHILKADQTLLKPTVILKADSLKANLCVHVSMYNTLCHFQDDVNVL